MEPAMEGWCIVRYRPVGLFSLRQSQSTSSGGRTLLCPTPYAFKLAVTDAAFRAGGLAWGPAVFTDLCHRRVRFRPPARAVVTNTFVKIKREKKEPDPREPYISSIGFREFCFFEGDLEVAVEVAGLPVTCYDRLVTVLRHVNYFGKRGSFFQYLEHGMTPTLPSGFTAAVPSELSQVDPSLYGTTQFLDDVGDGDPERLFEALSTYSPKGAQLDRDRVTCQYLLPYRMEESARNYTSYRRITGEGQPSGGAEDRALQDGAGGV